MIVYSDIHILFEFAINNACDVVKLLDLNHVTNFRAHVSFSNLQFFEIHVDKSMKQH